MIKIAIVDDQEDCLKENDEIISSLLSDVKISFVTYKYRNGYAFLEHLNENFDLVFMDIEMDYKNGIEIAKKIRETDDKMVIIFITSFAKYAVDGYQVNAFDYILKPITKQGLALKINRMLDEVKKKAEKKIKIESKEYTYYVPLSKISYIESMGHFLMYHTEYGNFEERKTFKEMEEQLKDDDFASCNRCYLVNMNNIVSIDKDTCYLAKDQLKISRSKKSEFLKTFDSFIKRVKT